MGYRKAADGIATKGKTKGTAVSMKGYTGMKEGGKVKMAKGGMSKMKDGGKVKMRSGGAC